MNSLEMLTEPCPYCGNFRKRAEEICRDLQDHKKVKLIAWVKDERREIDYLTIDCKHCNSRGICLTDEGSKFLQAIWPLVQDELKQPVIGKEIPY